MIESISSNIDKSMQSSIRTKMKFFNEYSLLKKFKYICSLEKNGFSFIFDDFKKLLTELVKYRNYLTHRSSIKEFKIDYSKLERFYFCLLIILEFCFLLELEYSSTDINRIMKSCSHFRYRKL